ncbi:hypothetical protein ACV229_21005 [Burkholderia sp. MR1-5-21]
MKSIDSSNYLSSCQIKKGVAIGRCRGHISNPIAMPVNAHTRNTTAQRRREGGGGNGAAGGGDDDDISIAMVNVDKLDRALNVSVLAVVKQWEMRACNGAVVG